MTVSLHIYSKLIPGFPLISTFHIFGNIAKSSEDGDDRSRWQGPLTKEKIAPAKFIRELGNETVRLNLVVINTSIDSGSQFSEMSHQLSYGVNLTSSNLM